MENRSKHYGDIKLWVEKVINSCENMGQIKTADRLINNFNKQLDHKCIINILERLLPHYY
jgi:hypothetical protein